MICADINTIAEYLDGRLDAVVAASLEEHISRCDDCYFVVREFVAARAETAEASSQGKAEAFPAPAPTPGSDRGVAIGARANKPRRSPFLTLLPLAAVLVVGTVSVALWRNAHIDPPGPRDALVKAVGARRFFDARLTGAFKYGELVSPKRGGASRSSESVGSSVRGPTGPAADDWEVLAAAAKVRQEIGTPGTAERRGTLAAAYLVLGDTAQAVLHLERAVADTEGKSPARARLLSDLAAAYLTRAFQEDRADDYPRALDRAAEALEIDPDLREALYNRALALEALRLEGEAVKAWDLLLAKEKDPGWREEAIRRRDTLSTRPRQDFEKQDRDTRGALLRGTDAELDKAVAANVGIARDLFELELLPDVVKQTARARRLGGALHRVSGDQYALGILDMGPLSKLEPRAGLYAKARRLHDAQNRGEALPLFREVVRQGRPDDVLSLWARQHMTVVNLGPEPRRALTECAELLKVTRSRALPILTARLLWVQGIAHDKLGESEPAIESFREARELLLQARVLDHAGFMGVQLAEAYCSAGQAPLSWRARIDGLAASDLLRERSRAYVGVLTATRAARDMGLPRAARHLIAEVETELSQTADSQDTGAIALLFERALVSSELSSQRALQDLGAVEPRILALKDDDARAWHQGQFELLAGRLSVPGAGDLASRERVERALGLARAQGLNDQTIPMLRLSLARWDLEEGHVEAALANLDAGMKAIEATRSEGSDLQRSEAAASVVPMTHLLELVLASPATPVERSLLLAERLHALTFESARSLTASNLKRLRRELPERSAVLVLLGLPKSIAAWSISRTNLSFRMIPSRSRIIAATQDLAGELPAKAERSAAARELSALLLAQVFDRLATAESVAVVAEGDLANIPFASLPRPDSSGPWGATTEIVSAPTLGFALSAPRSAKRRPRVLAVGSPADTRFSPLPFSRVEVAGIIEAHGGGTSLLGAEATLDGLRRRLPQATVLHLASHAVLNPNRPEASSIVLAGGRDLDAGSIGRLRLQGVDLVTLAVCDSGRTTASAGIGSFDFANAFLGAGAGQVLAARAALPDDSRLFLEFHRLISKGATPRAALRELRRESQAARLLLNLYAPLNSKGNPV